MIHAGIWWRTWTMVTPSILKGCWKFVMRIQRWIFENIGDRQFSIYMQLYVRLVCIPCYHIHVFIYLCGLRGNSCFLNCGIIRKLFARTWSSCHLERVISMHKIGRAPATRKLSFSAASLLAQSKSPFDLCFPCFFNPSRKRNDDFFLTFVSNVLCETEWIYAQWLLIKIEIKVICSVSFVPNNIPSEGERIKVKNISQLPTRGFLAEEIKTVSYNPWANSRASASPIWTHQCWRQQSRVSSIALGVILANKDFQDHINLPAHLLIVPSVLDPMEINPEI